MGTPRRFVPLMLCVALWAGTAAAQETPGEAPALPGDARPLAEVGRESMWPAPTAEDWKKPCLVTWQRTWEDAVLVAKETGRPILVCINMDGEIASEHYAGVRYRQPEVAALYEPYVTVIASVYRHNPADYDDEGQRIPCPRFGGVTCGEHIAIEPIIFEKFCDGRRIAPRHICVELDGNESYDVYFANDTASVFRAIHDGIAGRPPLPPQVVRSDRPILERVPSSDVRDRVAVEQAYAEGDAAARRALLDAALKAGPDRQVELLRLAVFGLDVDLARAARRTLAGVANPDATRLVADALRLPMPPEERDALLDALKRLGEKSPLARYLAIVHRGLSEGSTAVDPTAWPEMGAGGTYPSPAPGLHATELQETLESGAQASEDRPDDPALRVELAEASLALSMRAPEIYTDPQTAGLLARYLQEDARRWAREAEGLGATGWRVNAVLALAAYYGDDLDDAYARAEKAMKELPAGDTSWTSMAVVTVFAESRWKAIKAAVRENREWPAEWLRDLHAAYSTLVRHPLGTDAQVVWHYDLLDWLGAFRGAERVLRMGYERFPMSVDLHQRMRDHYLKLRGPDGLEAAYEEMRREREDPAAIAAFAGAASVAAAEHHRRKADYGPARAAYGRAIAHYERFAEAWPVRRGSADAAVALALAGRARVADQLGDLDGAAADIVASLERSPDTAGTRDGMGITPGETAQMVLARLRAQGPAEGAARVEAALAKVDPDLLVPDEG